MMLQKLSASLEITFHPRLANSCPITPVPLKGSNTTPLDSEEQMWEAILSANLIFEPMYCIGLNKSVPPMETLRLPFIKRLIFPLLDTIEKQFKFNPFVHPFMKCLS